MPTLPEMTGYPRGGRRPARHSSVASSCPSSPTRSAEPLLPPLPIRVAAAGRLSLDEQGARARRRRVVHKLAAPIQGCACCSGETARAVATQPPHTGGGLQPRVVAGRILNRSRAARFNHWRLANSHPPLRSRRHLPPYKRGGLLRCYGTSTTVGRQSRLPGAAGRAAPPGGVSPSGAPPSAGLTNRAANSTLIASSFLGGRSL